MSPEKAFRPQLPDLLGSQGMRSFSFDLRAGVLVALFALPVCLAFGTAVGLGPGAGVLTSVVAGFFAALLGGGRVQITGPTAVFLVVSAAIVQDHGTGGLAIATLAAGLLLMAAGFFRLGPILRFLPQPILTGFTAGIAVTLVGFELKDLLGLTVAGLPANLVDRLAALAGLFPQMNGVALVLGLATAALALVGDRLFPKVPWYLVALVIASAVVAVFALPVPTIRSTLGAELVFAQPLDFSRITWGSLVQILPSAFTLAFLGAIESLVSASVADGLISDRHRPNTELIAQGVANAASALTGGLPATGATGRTSVSIRMGARTPLAGMFHALTLLGLWFLLVPWLGMVPVPALAGLVVAVALRLVNVQEFRLMLRTTQADALALGTTFVVTLLFDLVFAVITGLLVAFFFFVRDMAQSSHTAPDRTRAAELPPGVRVLDLNGAFFFGAAAQFDEAIRPLLKEAQTIILRMDDVSMLDATGTRVLRRLLKDAHTAQVRVIMASVQPSVLRVMEPSELIAMLGTSNLFASFEGALRDVKNKQPLVFSIRPEQGCFDPL